MARIKHFLKDIWIITKKSAVSWKKSDPFRQSAVVAYYAIFSIPPLLIIIIAFVGFVFGEEAIRGEISSQISDIMGEDTALQIEKIIANINKNESSKWAAIISIITLFVGCTGVFVQLQIILNEIWEIKVTAKRKFLKSLKDRLLSFGLILSIGFLLLVSLILTTALSVLSDWIRNYLPSFLMIVFQLIDFILSFGVVTVLFALMFKILPDARIRWNDVWVGAIVTALLFIVGKFGLAIYFGKAEPASAYGAAGSIILIMLWVSYSCMLVLFGAEFTKQLTLYFRGKIEPKEGAIHIDATKVEKLIVDKKKAVRQLEH